MDELLEEFCEVSDELSEILANRKEQSEILKGLKPEIIKHLESINDEHSTEVNNRRIYLKTTKSKKSINKESLTKILTDYFQGNVAKAEDCVNYVWDNRETNEKTDVKLGKVKGKKEE